MSTHYIDTSTLKWRYLSGLPTVTVNQLMDNPEHRVFTSELTLLEWSNALASECREGRIDYETYKINELAFMRDIVLPAKLNEHKLAGINEFEVA